MPIIPANLKKGDRFTRGGKEIEVYKIDRRAKCPYGLKWDGKLNWMSADEIKTGDRAQTLLELAKDPNLEALYELV
jgi:hypothetical protein